MGNYRRGADFERAIQEDLEAVGYFVVRAAGSHGAADLVAFPEGGNRKPWPRPWIIQAKTNGRLAPAERAALLELGYHYDAIPVLATKIKRKAGAIYARVTGPGPHDLEALEP